MSVKMDSTETMLCAGLENILFAGVCLHMSAQKLIRLGSEAVNER